MLLVDITYRFATSRSVFAVAEFKVVVFLGVGLLAPGGWCGLVVFIEQTVRLEVVTASCFPGDTGSFVLGGCTGLVSDLD